MALPTDGFTPDGLRYRLYDNTMLVDRIVIDVDLGNEQWLPRAVVDDVLRPHMEAAYADLLAAAANTDIALLAEYRGARVNDLTPPPGGGA